MTINSRYLICNNENRIRITQLISGAASQLTDADMTDISSFHISGHYIASSL